MAAPPRGEALRRLDAWLRLGGARFPLLRLEADGADAGACVRAVSDAPADTELLAVPRALLISSDEARAGSRVCAAVAAAGVVLSAPRNCDLAIFILEDGALRPGAASRHRAYYDALPRAFPGSPSFWSAAELAALLTGSPMVSLVAQRSAAWRADYDAIAAVAPEWPAVATPDEWAWARAVVASRNFAMADGKTVVDALVPLAGACAGALACARGRRGGGVGRRGVGRRAQPALPAGVRQCERARNPPPRASVRGSSVTPPSASPPTHRTAPPQTC